MVVLHRFSAVDAFRAALVLAAFWSVGCGSQPESGSVVPESEQVKAAREAGVKSAMERGAYGPKYARKAEPSAKVESAK